MESKIKQKRKILPIADFDDPNNSIDNFCSLPDRVKEDHQEVYRKYIRSIGTDSR